MRRILNTLLFAILFSSFAQSEQLELFVINQIVPYENDNPEWDTEQRNIIGEQYEDFIYLYFNQNVASEAHVFIKNGDRCITQSKVEIPTVFSIDMTNKPRGHYFIEIYTDDTALGGEFELE